ncbi:alcohol dehydrogenase [Enhydrobacter aerosaccus]|uniref:Alcohol dehydrogenase n=1 Tax=Enhydrobacter aerosaccus TaxID=225324 RepID=A0A1T4SWJ7_9HYPH|nr:zinc-binding alcohol dehydrogenase family protein [Enhydrobacter aerosaccus]SKA32288.1 alcohol dehydrogenase [Enhydrobacter aerosaccus]
MRAAILKAFGSPLTLETVPDPVLGTGEVIVDVVATRVLAYANEVFSGARNYLMELPMIPGSGAVGRVRALGPDATHLSVGDWVYCDPTVRSRDDALMPEIILQGLVAGSQPALRLQRYFHDGSFAEQMRVPTENVVRIGALDEAEAAAWCALGTLLVPYGGFAAANLTPGETVVVNGATGAFGSAGVAVAMAMGAKLVVATGRNETALADLERRYGRRVRAVRMLGNEESDRGRILEAASGPIDCVLDLLPPAASPSQVRTAVMAVRPYGRVVLMGGVGMAGGAGLELPYPWLMRNCITVRGQWMYAREASTRMIGLVRAGLIDLADFQVTSFGLDAVNEAVTHAAANAGPFRFTVIKP